MEEKENEREKEKEKEKGEHKFTILPTDIIHPIALIPHEIQYRHELEPPNARETKGK